MDAVVYCGKVGNCDVCHEKVGVRTVSAVLGFFSESPEDAVCMKETTNVRRAYTFERRRRIYAIYLFLELG